MEGSGEASRLQINFGEAGTKWLVVGVRSVGKKFNEIKIYR